MINYHRLPGPGLYQMTRTGISPYSSNQRGNVGVNLGFGFGIGYVPGFEVDVGGGVNVGPFPGWDDDVGVNIATNLGILGGGTPEAYRRGYDRPKNGRGPIVDLSGGVGVNAPGSGPIGVGTGLGVGR